MFFTLQMALIEWLVRKITSSNILSKLKNEIMQCETFIKANGEFWPFREELLALLVNLIYSELIKILFFTLQGNDTWRWIKTNNETSKWNWFRCCPKQFTTTADPTKYPLKLICIPNTFPNSHIPIENIMKEIESFI